jgi:hypothetical protein
MKKYKDVFPTNPKEIGKKKVKLDKDTLNQITESKEIKNINN